MFANDQQTHITKKKGCIGKFADSCYNLVNKFSCISPWFMLRRLIHYILTNFDFIICSKIILRDVLYDFHYVCIKISMNSHFLLYFRLLRSLSRLKSCSDLYCRIDLFCMIRIWKVNQRNEKKNGWIWSGKKNLISSSFFEAGGGGV